MTRPVRRIRGLGRADSSRELGGVGVRGEEGEEGRRSVVLELVGFFVGVVKGNQQASR